MTATIQFVRETFSKFNKLCFEDKLPPIPVVLTYARTFLGKVTYKGKRDIFGSEDPFFNGFPRSKTPKLYKITREELDKHLADAISLVCDGHNIFPKPDNMNPYGNEL